MYFAVRTPADFGAVERHVSNLLSSDESRCSFLRSEAFSRIRVHAMYRMSEPVTPPPCWGPEGLCVEVKNRMVSVEIREPAEPTYDSSWAGPVVYNVLSGFHGNYDVLAKTQGPFARGRPAREARDDAADELV